MIVFSVSEFVAYDCFHCFSCQLITQLLNREQHPEIATFITLNNYLFANYFFLVVYFFQKNVLTF